MSEFKQTHSPWCRIHHNPGSTTECWCASDIAATAYKLGRAEGNAAIADQRRECYVIEARARLLATSLWDSADDIRALIFDDLPTDS